MASEVVLHIGVPSFEAAVALSKGDVITLDSAGKFAKSAAGDEVVFVAGTDAAQGEQVAGRRETQLSILVEGHDGTSAAAIAVGDDLMVAAGKLRKHAGSAKKAAKAMAAVGSGVSAVTPCLLAI
jgi:hypothetical protein